MQTRGAMIYMPKSPAGIRAKKRWKLIRKHWQYYLIFAVPFALLVIFSYVPMGGILLAFKNFYITQGIWKSPWAGLYYFNEFFSSPLFWSLLGNTVGISVYSLVVGFPIPIILALMLNEAHNARFKRTVQLVTYAPYFISTVVMVSIILNFLDLRTGFVNRLLTFFGGQAQDFMSNPNLLWSIYVWSGVWQNSGYAAIIYIAALSSIDPNLYEAAFIDGASRFQKIVHIDVHRG